MIRISCNFDGGAIDVVDSDRADDLAVRIRRDSHQDFTQWFYFRVSGARDQPIVLRFLNAGECTYAHGWQGYNVVASYDRRDWFRIATRYADGVMSVAHTPAADTLYIAYFEPYSWERHLDLLARAQGAPASRIRTLAQTRDGRDLDLIHLTARAANAARVWIIARQHPGETLAEWFVEGLVERLIDDADPLARTARERADFYLVPNMNPDGSVRGNLRTNASGANLNREWADPTQERSPEVLSVRAAMLASGVDLFLDVHGDEVLPYIFVAGSEMLPSFSERQRNEQEAFVADFMNVSPDFQATHGYPSGKYSDDALKLASKWVGNQFACLSLTLEMPFKDNANLPDPAHGWSGARSRHLGAAALFPIVQNLRRRPG